MLLRLYKYSYRGDSLQHDTHRQSIRLSRRLPPAPRRFQWYVLRLDESLFSLLFELNDSILLSTRKYSTTHVLIDLSVSLLNITKRTRTYWSISFCFVVTQLLESIPGAPLRRLETSGPACSCSATTSSTTAIFRSWRVVTLNLILFSKRPSVSGTIPMALISILVDHPRRLFQPADSPTTGIRQISSVCVMYSLCF